MSDVVHDSMLHHFLRGANWQTADLRAALFLKSTWTPSPSDGVVLDATGAGAVEVAAPSYARAVLASNVANTDGTNHRELLSTAVIDFGALEAGFDYDTLVVFVHVTDDTDSWLVTSIDLGAQTTTGADERFVPDAVALIAVTPS